ncbi:MAG: YkgJ family cysteine cluster protein [Candidatus Nanoarchaeia archaeon]
MEINELAEKARNSLGSYCFEYCKAYCCRKGYLIINKEEAEIITGNRIEEYIEMKKLKQNRNSYVLYLSGGCPALKDFKCTLHKDPNRPYMCREFPVFVKGDCIFVAERCHAKERFYPVFSEAKRLGIEIRYF